MFESKKICPRCRSARLKSWNELTSDEKFTAERLPASAEISPEERQQHSFCPRCWFETAPFEEKA
jgi:ssDNA-binding Zn-finger/Zn-ribbon topoisomerase 1